MFISYPIISLFPKPNDFLGFIFNYKKIRNIKNKLMSKLKKN